MTATDKVTFTKTEFEKIITLRNDADNISKEIDKLQVKYDQSTFKNFMHRNWWKISGALIGLATIMGLLADAVFHLIEHFYL